MTRKTPKVDDLARIARAAYAYDFVRAAEIARRCQVDRVTVWRWRHRPNPNGRRVLPRPHVVLGVDEFWSWTLLSSRNPDRFPPRDEADS